MAKLDYPVTFGIRKYSFRTCAAAVAAIVQQQPGIIILLFFQNFKSNLLKPVEIGYRLFPVKNNRRRITESAHTVITHNGEPV